MFSFGLNFAAVTSTLHEDLTCVSVCLEVTGGCGTMFHDDIHMQLEKNRHCTHAYVFDAKTDGIGAIHKARAEGYL